MLVKGLARLKTGLLHVLGQRCIACLFPTIEQPCPYCAAQIRTLPMPSYNYDLRNWPRVAQSIRPHLLAPLHVTCEYSYPFSHWIAELKLQGKLFYIAPLARLFSAGVKSRPKQLPDLILPAPMHFSRYLKRQFSHTRELTIAIGKQLNVPVLDSGLVKTRLSPPQRTLSRADRLMNMDNSFACKSFEPSVKRVAIFDDVVTTGATMQAMLNAVRATNPHIELEVWSLAITLPRVD